MRPPAPGRLAGFASKYSLHGDLLRGLRARDDSRVKEFLLHAVWLGRSSIAVPSALEYVDSQVRWIYEGHAPQRLSLRIGSSVQGAAGLGLVHIYLARQADALLRSGKTEAVEDMDRRTSRDGRISPVLASVLAAYRQGLQNNGNWYSLENLAQMNSLLERTYYADKLAKADEKMIFSHLDLSVFSRSRF